MCFTVTPTLSINCITCMQHQGEEKHESHGKLRLKDFAAPAPYGGVGGRFWDDGIFNGVREITVASGLCIDSIHVAYDKDGELVNAEKHGGGRGRTHPQIRINYPDEFLVSVSGTYFEMPLKVGGVLRHPVVIRSLKFKSNKRAFGPFGTEVGTPFTFTVADGGQIVGMKGRSSLYLDAIGVHISDAPRRKLLHRSSYAESQKAFFTEL